MDRLDHNKPYEGSEQQGLAEEDQSAGLQVTPTKEESRWIALGALKGALLIGAAYLIGGALLIWLILALWA